MKTLVLLNDLVFDDERPHAEPLLTDVTGRVLRFTLKPGQHIREHCAPHSPVHIIVMQGEGMFAGANGRELRLKAGWAGCFRSGRVAPGSRA